MKSTSPMQHLKIFAKLALIFGLLSLTACGGLPLVTLHQLDLKHGVVNPMRITKYNEETCRLEIEEEPPFPLVMSQMSILHGGVCLTAEEAALYKEDLQTKCKNARDERKR